MSDALKEARTSSLFILATSLLWILTSDAVTATLQTRNDVQAFASWILLKDTLRSINQRASESSVLLEDAAVGDTITTFNESHDSQSGTQVDQTLPMVASAPWRPGMTEQFSLRRVDGPEGAAIFEIIPTTGLIVPEGYLLVLLSDRSDVYVVEATRFEHPTLRAIMQQLFEQGIEGPAGLQAVVNLMRTRGEVIDDPSSLRSTDKIVAQLLSEVTEERYTVASLPFSPGLFPSAICIFVGLASFVLLGPTLRLWRSSAEVDPNESWIMALSLPGFGGALLRASQIAVLCFCALLPLYVLWDQKGLVPLMTDSERLLWWPSSVGLLLGTAVMGSAGLLLVFRIWRRPASSDIAMSG